MEEVNHKRKAANDLKEQETEKKKKLKKDLESREDVKGFINWCIENKVYQHSRQTDRTNAASLTSTNFDPFAKGVTSFRDLKES